MVRTVCETIILLLAFYGAARLADRILFIHKARRKRIGEGMELVLKVRNREDIIEGVIRNVMSDGFLQGEFSCEKLHVEDCGSIDRTPEILERLAGEYSRLQISTRRRAKDDTGKKIGEQFPG